jgi:hypothetical protein
MGFHDLRSSSNQNDAADIPYQRVCLTVLIDSLKQQRPANQQIVFLGLATISPELAVTPFRKTA